MDKGRKEKRRERPKRKQKAERRVKNESSKETRKGGKEESDFAHAKVKITGPKSL